MMYNTIQEQKENLLAEDEKLHQRHELAGTVGVDYFEPGMMEYLEQSDGVFDETNGEMLVRFEVKGTRYEGRTEQIEKVKTGDIVQIVRDCANPYNPNNFMILKYFLFMSVSMGPLSSALKNFLYPLRSRIVVSIFLFFPFFTYLHGLLFLGTYLYISHQSQKLDNNDSTLFAVENEVFSTQAA